LGPRGKLNEAVQLLEKNEGALALLGQSTLRPPQLLGKSADAEELLRKQQAEKECVHKLMELDQEPAETRGGGGVGGEGEGGRGGKREGKEGSTEQDLAATNKMQGLPLNSSSPLRPPDREHDAAEVCTEQDTAVQDKMPSLPLPLPQPLPLSLPRPPFLPLLRQHTAPDPASLLSPRAEFAARQEDFARTLMLQVQELEVELADAQAREQEALEKVQVLLKSESEKRHVCSRSSSQIRALSEELTKTVNQVQDFMFGLEMAEKANEREREKCTQERGRLESVDTFWIEQREKEKEAEHARDRVRDQERAEEREKATARIAKTIAERKEWRRQEIEREHERERERERERESMKSDFEQQQSAREHEWEKEKDKLVADLKLKERELRQVVGLTQELDQLRSEVQFVCESE
jgi:hypothetical protein